MKIVSIQTLHCDAGWRPWSFIKIVTDEGLVGWSECTDSHGSPRGIAGVVEDLSPLLIGKNPCSVEELYWLMYARTRQSPGSIIQKAIGGIENALLDIKAKSLGVPVYDLFGGQVRKKIPLYWSHFGTTRVRAAAVTGTKPIRAYKDVEDIAREAERMGIATVKTNCAILDQGEPFVYMPGFAKSEGGPALNVDGKVLVSIEKWVRSLRDALPQSDIVLDLNFNFKPEGLIRIAYMLEAYHLLWLEMDVYSPTALRFVRDKVSTPICSGENLYGTRQYKPYFDAGAMDIASVDVIWNGFMQSKKIADLAEIHEINVTPHNYNGHLSTFISAHFCASVPNVRLMEIDIDDVPWRDELFSSQPMIDAGVMNVPNTPGWGTEVNESVLKRHPWPR